MGLVLLAERFGIVKSCFQPRRRAGTNKGGELAGSGRLASLGERR